MTLLTELGLPTLKAVRAAAAARSRGAAEARLVDAAKAQWQARLKQLTALARTLDDRTVKAGLAGAVKAASEIVDSAAGAMDATARAKLYQAAVRKLDVAAAAAAAKAPAASKVAAATADSSTAVAGPAKKASEESRGGKAFSVGVPGLPKLLKKSVSIGKAQFEIQIAPTLTIAGKADLDDADTTKLSSAGVRVALDWFEKEGTGEVASKGLLANAKFERKGLALTATTTTRTKLGKITLTMTFVGIGAGVTKELNAKAAVKVLEAEGELEPASIKLGDQEVLGLKLSGLEVKLGGKVTVAPNWSAILIRWAVEEGAKDMAKEAGETLVVAVGADVVIMGSFIVAGVATIGGAVYQIVQGWAIGDLAKSYTASVEAMQAGFRAGMSNGAAPGDRFGAVGFEQGRNNYQAVFAKAKKDNPGATDAAIATAVVAKADAALKAVANELDKAVRKGMWDGYLGQHTSVLLGDNARWGYVACFGDEPNSKSPDEHWRKYMDQHPMQAKLSPK